MPIAITCGVSPNLARCELTHLEREPIDVEFAARQHSNYESLLVELGCELRTLPPAADLPDSVFVEDTAIVVDELALLTRPGAESRRPEIPAMAEALGDYRSLVTLTEPATLDGGDVLVMDRDVYIGLSSRTNPEGVEQVRRALAPHGYTVIPVSVKGCLHLKTAVGRVGSDTLLLNPAWVDGTLFGNRNRIEVDPGEPGASGALLLGETVVYSDAFPRTRVRLEENGIRTATLDLSELEKAEAGVTCCSLVFRAPRELPGNTIS